MLAKEGEELGGGWDGASRAMDLHGHLARVGQVVAFGARLGAGRVVSVVVSVWEDALERGDGLAPPRHISARAKRKSVDAVKLNSRMCTSFFKRVSGFSTT